MKNIIHSNTFIVVLLIICSPAFAQTITTEQKNDIALEVFQMSHSMDELISLLKEDRTQRYSGVELQKLEVAISYLNYRSRRIEFKEQELVYKKRTRDAMQQTLDDIKNNPKPWKRFDTQEQKQMQPQLQNQEDKEDYRIEHMEKRIDAIDSEIITLEIEISSLKKEISDFEYYVQKKLKLFE